MTLRVGLFGTGFWASEVHGPGVVASPLTELVGVWGRDPAKTATLADRLGTHAYDDVDRLIADVEAVTIALPPDVQAPIAERAARAGRHLLLDKPVALTSVAARGIADAADAAGVASLVFFTMRFRPEVVYWIAECCGPSGWDGGQALLLGSVLEEGSPFAASPWRRDKGGLWDVGPHALSVLLPVLGPVAAVAAATLDAQRTAHLLLRHASGAVSTVSVGIGVAPAAAQTAVSVYGPAGTAVLPSGDWDAPAAYAEALRELVAAIENPRSAHPCNVRFGAEVTAVLEQAERLL